MPTLEDAIAFAVEAHHGQKDKNGQPYILHPLRVMLRLESERERIVGVLHDVIEDTPTTLDDLLARDGRGSDLGRAGRLYALSAFAPESAARRYAEIYRQVLGRNAS